MANVRWLPRAEDDLHGAITWYAARSAATAARFEAVVASAVGRIEAMPEMYGAVDDRHRACPISKFPYVLVYRYEAAADEVLVVAVVHTSQDPAAWQSPT